MSNISRCKRPISRLTVESATPGNGPISSATAAAAAAAADHSNWFRGLFREDPRLSNEMRFPCQV